MKLIDDPTKKALWCSASLHVLVLLVLLGGSFLGWHWRRYEPPVFALVPPPEEAVEAGDQPLPQDSADSSVALPRPDETQQLTEVSQQVAVGSPEPAPPTRVSYRNFVRDHGDPRDLPEPFRGREPPKVVVPTIDTESIRSHLERVLTRIERQPTEVASPRERDRESEYLSRVRKSINDAWRKPRGLSGREYQAVVEFSVVPEGAIGAVDFVQSSGNELFDNSVMAAFDRVRTVDSPPSGQDYRLRLTFQMIEELP